MVQEIFNCLFELPNIQINNKKDIFDFPKCKTKESRISKTIYSVFF